MKVLDFAALSPLPFFEAKEPHTEGGELQKNTRLKSLKHPRPQDCPNNNDSNATHNPKP